MGARVHLAEPAETSALRGTKKHAKSDRADARHLRELPKRTDVRKPLSGICGFRWPPVDNQPRATPAST